ncbi:hypothetical protein HAV15_003392 [Penicillium sp. str. |nr:hypothetical protein HAV15_003392 [Penicillium sp. str. \
MKKLRTASWSATNDTERDIPSPDRPITEGQQKILGLIASLHFSSEYSDLEIVCEGKVFSAHKLVVCPRSDYFHKACCGGFKEAKEPIYLNDKSSILLEKVLEFLYTGDYIVGNPRPESDSLQADGYEKSEVYTENVGSQSDGNAIDNLTPETEELVTEIDQPASESIAVKLANTSPKSEEPALFRKRPENGPSKQWGTRKPAVDTLIDCHPCYFHMRMYGEADYFMISDLKTKACEQFCVSFMDFPHEEGFTEIIHELYSTRG